jgi:WD40 repeat protein
MRTLAGHVDLVWSLALSKDGKLYSGSFDTTIRVWSAVDGSHLGTLEGHTGAVYVVAVAADDTVYTGSRDGTLRMWSGQDGLPMRTLQMDFAVWTITRGAGNTVFIGDVKRRVSVWKGGAALARTLYTFASRVSAMAIGQDGRLFVGGPPGFDVHAL